MDARCHKLNAALINDSLKLNSPYKNNKAQQILLTANCDKHSSKCIMASTLSAFVLRVKYFAWKIIRNKKLIEIDIETVHVIKIETKRVLHRISCIIYSGARTLLGSGGGVFLYVYSMVQDWFLLKVKCFFNKSFGHN